MTPATFRARDRGLCTCRSVDPLAGIENPENIRDGARHSVKILVFGPGVIGTLYAARLQESGQLVTVLARGERLAEIRRHGLTLEDVVSGRRSTVSALGEDRLLLGFPGAGGTSDGHIVRYALISQQPTTLGELNGRSSERVRSLAGAFKAAGFSTTISGDMDGWLKAHAFFVTAVSGAIYMAGGNCRRLSEDSASLTLMTKGVREGFAAVRSLGRTVTPFPLMVLFTWLPHRSPSPIGGASLRPIWLTTSLAAMPGPRRVRCVRSRAIA